MGRRPPLLADCAPGVRTPNAVGSRCALTHLNGQIGVGCVLDDQADGGVGGVEHRRRGRHGHSLCLSTHGKNGADGSGLHGVDDDVVLHQGFESLGGDFERVGAGQHGRDIEEACRRGFADGFDSSGVVGNDDTGMGNDGAGGIHDRAFKRSFAGGLCRNWHCGPYQTKR